MSDVSHGRGMTLAAVTHEGKTECVIDEFVLLNVFCRLANSYLYIFDAAKVVIILHMTLHSFIFLFDFRCLRRVFRLLMLNERKNMRDCSCHNIEKL